MNIVPIVFAFDNNLAFPAEICICSLLSHAKSETFYDIYILNSSQLELSAFDTKRIQSTYPRCKFTFITVGESFSGSYEIRDITNVTYYRLLIPKLIPEYDKIVYSDVDVIFRDDLSEVYNSTIFDKEYIAGVRALSHKISGYANYYRNKLRIPPEDIIYAGNIIVNSKQIREDGLVDVFCEMAKKNFCFQDMDIINIVCQGRIKYLKPSFCVTTYFMDFSVNDVDGLKQYWTSEDIYEALRTGIVHYNGQKPWKGWCVNFDIWWEYYRKSPFYDEKFYFDFFYNKLNEHDQLSLWKRVKILLRYFIFGRQQSR